MTRRRPIDAQPVADNPALRVLNESEADTWKRWSDDRARREEDERIRGELARREAADEPLYPTECAERIAEDTRAIAPDWRHIRPALGLPWRRLLKSQPELSPELTQQREQVITAVFASVPKHLRESVGDLRRLIDLLLTGHEAAAYQVGFEAGKRHERTRIDEKGRVRHSTRPPRRREAEGDTAPLRLTLAE